MGLLLFLIREAQNQRRDLDIFIYSDARMLESLWGFWELSSRTSLFLRSSVYVSTKAQLHFNLVNLEFSQTLQFSQVGQLLLHETTQFSQRSWRLQTSPPVGGLREASQEASRHQISSIRLVHLTGFCQRGPDDGGQRARHQDRVRQAEKAEQKNRLVQE